MKASFFRFAIFASLFFSVFARAEEKLIILDDVPAHSGRFEIAPDGNRLYFNARDGYLVFDAAGKYLERIGAPGAPRDLVPLGDGRFVAANAHSAGQIALVRSDGSIEKVVVSRGGSGSTLRSDGTGWTTPTGVAVDVAKKRIFALDTTMAPRGFADPDWSRIAVFDFDGKFIFAINGWNGEGIATTDALAQDAARTWYDDIEIDAARERVYVSARRSKEILAFGYDGKAIARAPGQGGIAVFSDGRVAAIAADGKGIQIYDADLKPLQSIPVAANYEIGRAVPEGRSDLEADGKGNLIASVYDSGTTFLRWNANALAAAPEEIGPRYVRMQVEWGESAAQAGEPLRLKVAASGRPAPAAGAKWQVFYRPSDGSDLNWKSLSPTVDAGVLQVTPPANLKGLYEIAVRYGDGPIDRANWRTDPFLQKTFALLPPGATRSVAVVPDSARRSFVQGETILLQLVRRAAAPSGSTPVALSLEHNGQTLAKTQLSFEKNYAAQIPAALSRRLAPGEYSLRPTAAGHESYALQFWISSSQAASPLQRILYHEFNGEPATVGQANLADVSERMAYIREYSKAAGRQGWTRETDRKGWSDSTWRRDGAPADLTRPGFAPPEFYGVPAGGNWETEFYLDHALRHGFHYDTQLLGHCAPVCFAPSDLAEKIPMLHRSAQWLGRYPAFYGFNYNDEMFFGGWDARWKAEAEQWLKDAEARLGSRAKAQLAALDHMYGSFNSAVSEANPDAKKTATPMWQFPAVEGSYAPTIYAGMNESYTHFLSEGYSLPWQPAHNVELLRRPDKPIMAVFDNGYSPGDGETYLKNWAQVLGLGVQGVGVEHTNPYGDKGILGSGVVSDSQAADAYTLANRLAQTYGAIFASCPPAPEAAVLYSFTQDVTETRNMIGTPHFERVFELISAGQMAGVATTILYEEDVQNNRLLDGKKPRVPMLFLVGQKQALPTAVAQKIKEFQSGGGKVFLDAASSDEVALGLSGTTKLALNTHRTGKLMQEGYAADSHHPLVQPELEIAARELKAAVGNLRRFALDTDDLWIGKNRLNGWGVQYLMLSSETGPYPWKAGDVWRLGAMYGKGSYGAYLPKTVNFSFPFSGGVVYDVFENEIVKPQINGGRASVEADLTLFPGRLYALAPAPLGAPKVTIKLDGASLEYSAQIVDASGKPISARVPIAIRLKSGADSALELFRATDEKGRFEGRINLPLTASQWTLEIGESLGGKSSATNLISPPLADENFIAARPNAEVWRETQIETLMKSGGVTLAIAGDQVLSAEQIQSLAGAFKARGVELKIAPGIPAESTPGVLLVAGSVKENTLGPVLQSAWQRGLFPLPLTDNVPGIGRGFACALFAPRAHGEHAIALLGGDKAGLDATVAAFIKWLHNEKPDAVPAPKLAVRPTNKFMALQKSLVATQTQSGAATKMRPLREAVGVRLDGITASPDGKNIVVSSKGYHRNLAIIEDAGASAKVVRALRVGQSPKIENLSLGSGGQFFGATARTMARHGQAFTLVEAASGSVQNFAAFGDAGRVFNRFAVSDDGNVLLAPGAFGVVCWKREGANWKEVWSIDAWKEFDKLDWPIHDTNERNPQFHALIPKGENYALILFGEKTPQGWIKPENPSRVWLAAVNLADGKERWRFDVPLPGALLFPTLHASSDGKRTVLQVQIGSWGEEKFRFYALDNASGKSIGAWGDAAAPASVALSSAQNGGVIATASHQRLIQLRREDGSLAANWLWDKQPASLAFSPDGTRLYLSDDAGGVACFDATGKQLWRVNAGSVSVLAATDNGVLAGGWDGRVRAFDRDGKARWKLDLTPSMRQANPMQALMQMKESGVLQAARASTASEKNPTGENFLQSEKATLKVGGTGGWMSNGAVQIKAEDLINGKTDDVSTPWLHIDEVFWDATTGRQVWAEIEFKTPTDVTSLTVHENSKFPDSWPTESVVQVWDESQKKWQTAARGTFLKAAANTYSLNLKGVSKLRYVPLGDYYRNFYTSEIEVR